MSGILPRSGSKRAAASITAFGVVLGGAVAAAPSASAAPARQVVSQTFSSIGGEQQFSVPAGVSSVTVVAVGARGGNGGDTLEANPWASLGGHGDKVTADLPVTALETLYVEVGGEGTIAGAAGFNGGGIGGHGDYGNGGGGGGASDIRTCSASASSCADAANSLASRLLVAAGGGGGGAGNSATGGQAAIAGPGGDANAPGGDVTYGSRGTANGGNAGTSTAGGTGGATSGNNATLPGGDGALGQGGVGVAASGDYAGSGGGGGGFYGGGGGGNNTYYGAGGGGGSDLVPNGGSATLDSTDPAQITISYAIGPVTGVAVDAAPAAIAADGVSTTTVTATATSADGIGEYGQPIEFTSSDPGEQFGAVTDNGDGTYTTTLTSSDTVGTATITATDTLSSVSGTTSVDQTQPSAPQIAAQLSSSHPASRSGWYRTPVTVRFICTAGTEPLTQPCPAPVAISRQGTHTIHRQVSGADQRTGSVTVRIMLDRTPPRVSVQGARNGGVYRSARHLTCKALDALSGLASCHIATKRHRTHSRRTVVSYVATARDRAGNVGQLRGSYRIR